MIKNEFMMLLTMSFRNLGRHKVKTVITSTAIAISVSLYIFMDAWIMGMNIDSRRNIVIYETGAAKIQTKAYFNKKKDLPMYESFSDYSGIDAVLDRNGYDSAPRFVFTGTIHSGTGTAPIVVHGVDPVKEARILRYSNFIDAGKFIEKGSRSIMLGFNAAQKLGVGIPYRLDRNEYETEILPAARNQSELEFIESLYKPYAKDNKESADSGKKMSDRLVLKTDVSKNQISKLWKILSEYGRMDVRISTTVDTKALPDKIEATRFSQDIEPLFTGKGKTALNRVYKKDPVVNYYLLTDSAISDRDFVLSRLLEKDYNGAIRHTNQLIDTVVCGIINSPNPKTNSHVAYISLDALQGESGMLLNGEINEILVRSRTADDSTLPGRKESPETIKNILLNSEVSRLFDEKSSIKSYILDVYSWKDYSEDFFAAAAGDRISTKVMIFFLFLLSFLGIANTMLMAILQRTKEIGMMRALGMSDKKLMIAYIINSAMIGIIGSSIGLVIGALINIPMVKYGIDYSAMTNAMDGDIGYRISSHFKSVWNLDTMVYTFFTAVSLSGIMAIPPILRALRKSVTETLRFE